MNNNPSVPDPRVVYADIISLPHHQSGTRPRMSLHDRAAQFAPFAALTGYDEMIGETARLTGREILPGEVELDRLDRLFRRLSGMLSAGQRPRVTVTFFVPDPRKAGGRYETVTGRVRRLDPVEKRLILLGGETRAGEISLCMDRILDLSGDVPEEDC